MRFISPEWADDTPQPCEGCDDGPGPCPECDPAGFARFCEWERGQWRRDRTQRGIAAAWWFAERGIAPRLVLRFKVEPPTCSGCESEAPDMGAPGDTHTYDHTCDAMPF